MISYSATGLGGTAVGVSDVVRLLAGLQQPASGSPSATNHLKRDVGAAPIQATPGRGKRGGSRVIYYWLAKEEHIYLLTVYAKGAKDDLTAAERDAWRWAVEAIEND